MWEILSLDIPPLLAAIFCSVACAILGNFLILRRLSLMGDAISHSVLPGIVIAFILTSSRASLPVFLGATISGVVCAILIELVRKYGRIESSASMGVVFSIFFALGVLLIEQAAARSVDLDADCLLHGQLESIFWYPPHDFSELFSVAVISEIPAEVVASFFAMCVVIVFVLVLYKELKVSSFDPAFSDAIGMKSSFLYSLLMVFVAVSVVASFKVVGSILVISMLICPAAAARVLTNDLRSQIFLSVVFGVSTCVVGYTLAAFGPGWLGFSNSVSASGMMTVVSGIVLFLAIAYQSIKVSRVRFRPQSAALEC